jgi:hypothetical protein
MSSGPFSESLQLTKARAARGRRRLGALVFALVALVDSTLLYSDPRRSAV